MSDVVNLATWKQRVNISEGVRRMLDIATAVPADDPNVWAEAQTLYEVTARLCELFRAAATKPNHPETAAETELREVCFEAGNQLSDVCRSIEEAWIAAYVIPPVQTTDETRMRKAA